jgi:hypothetical protein
MKNWKLTKAAYLNKLYRYMKDRVTYPYKSLNINGKRTLNYYGLPLCSREEFLRFAMKSRRFDRIFKGYKSVKGRSRGYAPSVDRINNKQGYQLNNIQFLTLSDNVSKSNQQRRNWIYIKNNKTGRVLSFSSTRKVSEFLGQKGRVNLRHVRFTNLKTGIKFHNLTDKKTLESRLSA